MRRSRIPVKSTAKYNPPNLTESNRTSSHTESGRCSIKKPNEPSCSPQYPWKFLCEEKWTHVPTEEPLNDDMKSEVRLELKKYWHFYRRDEIYRRETKLCWMYEGFILKLGETPAILGPDELERFCNKPTTFYWEQSAQRSGRCPGLIFGCLYEEWFRCHNGDPNVEFGRFFASPVQITSGGPRTVAGILTAHESICEQAAFLLAKIARDKPEDDWTNGSPARWPSSRDYTLFSLCRAIIVIIDQLNLDTGPDPGSVVLREQSQRQSVLIIRTGKESHLSAPISFDSIKTESLPLNRIEVGSNGIEAVRVSLATAVDFVAKLQRREEAAFPSSGDRLVIDGHLNPIGVRGALGHPLSADTWADQLIEEAEAKGYDNVHETWSAIRRLKARKRGEVFDELTPYHFDARWR